MTAIAPRATPPLASAPLINETLDRLEARRHTHGTRCWWSHLEARWICSAG